MVVGVLEFANERNLHLLILNENKWILLLFFFLRPLFSFLLERITRSKYNWERRGSTYSDNIPPFAPRNSIIGQKYKLLFSL